MLSVAETPVEEGQDDDELDSGSIVGIVIGCLVAALLIIILIIVSVIAVYRDRKKRIGKAEFKSTNPELLNRYGLIGCKFWKE